MPRLGIGITTYNRSASLVRTLEAVARHTTTPYTLIVADDGSSDDTRAVLRARRVPHLGGPNRGIAWNKNRVLFHLHAVAGCDTVILLEDDTAPTADGWERPWIEAAERWGHVNFAGSWFADRIVSGTGTPADPYLSTQISGQCVAFNRAALNRVGYMDTRFGRYGFEHCDHSERMLGVGYGGRAGDPALYYLIESALRVGIFSQGDYRDDLERNALVYLEVLADRRWHRWPWRSVAEMRRLLRECRAAELDDRMLRLRRALVLAIVPWRWLGKTATRHVVVWARRRRRVSPKHRWTGPGQRLRP